VQSRTQRLIAAGALDVVGDAMASSVRDVLL